MVKLTKAQWACLRKLSEQKPEPFGGWCNYGANCGVKRNVAMALEARGLAQVRHDDLGGVTARITESGRAVLQNTENDDG